MPRSVIPPQGRAAGWPPQEVTAAGSQPQGQPPEWLDGAATGAAEAVRPRQPGAGRAPVQEPGPAADAAVAGMGCAGGSQRARGTLSHRLRRACCSGWPALRKQRPAWPALQCSCSVPPRGSVAPSPHVLLTVLSSPALHGPLNAGCCLSGACAGGLLSLDAGLRLAAVPVNHRDLRGDGPASANPAAKLIEIAALGDPAVRLASPGSTSAAWSAVGISSAAPALMRFVAGNEGVRLACSKATSIWSSETLSNYWLL